MAEKLSSSTADQFFYCPIAMFFRLLTLGVYLNLTFSESVEIIFEDNFLVEAMISNFKLSSATQFINFYWIPLRYQLLYDSATTIIMTTY